MSTLTLATDHDYLGREFLTWIWFLCEVEGGTFELPSGVVDMVVEDNLVLVGHDDEDSATQVKGGKPSQRPEAASALASGMTARRARLIAARGEREWSFTLDAETLDLRSVKVPNAEAEEPLEALTERLESAEELRKITEELYGKFLSLRLSDGWDGKEAERMRSWIRIKLEQATADHNRFAA